MLELFSEFARDFTPVDTESWTILLIMVGWSTLILQISVDSKSFTALFVPGMVLGGMAALYRGPHRHVYDGLGEGNQCHHA